MKVFERLRSIALTFWVVISALFFSASLFAAEVTRTFAFEDFIRDGQFDSQLYLVGPEISRIYDPKILEANKILEEQFPNWEVVILDTSVGVPDFFFDGSNWTGFDSVALQVEFVWSKNAALDRSVLLIVLNELEFYFLASRSFIDGGINERDTWDDGPEYIGNIRDPVASVLNLKPRDERDFDDFLQAVVEVLPHSIEEVAKAYNSLFQRKISGRNEQLLSSLEGHKKRWGLLKQKLNQAPVFVYRPDVIEDALSQFDDALDRNELGLAQEISSRIDRELSSTEVALSNWKNANTEIERLAQKLSFHSDSVDSHLIETELADLSRFIELARSSHENGDSSYQEPLSQASSVEASIQPQIASKKRSRLVGQVTTFLFLSLLALFAAFLLWQFFRSEAKARARGWKAVRVSEQFLNARTQAFLELASAQKIKIDSWETSSFEGQTVELLHGFQTNHRKLEDCLLYADWAVQSAKNHFLDSLRFGYSTKHGLYWCGNRAHEILEKDVLDLWPIDSSDSHKNDVLFNGEGESRSDFAPQSITFSKLCQQIDNLRQLQSENLELLIEAKNISASHIDCERRLSAIVQGASEVSKAWPTSETYIADSIEDTLSVQIGAIVDASEVRAETDPVQELEQLMGIRTAIESLEFFLVSLKQRTDIYRVEIDQGIASLEEAGLSGIWVDEALEKVFLELKKVLQLNQLKDVDSISDRIEREMSGFADLSNSISSVLETHQKVQAKEATLVETRSLLSLRAAELSESSGLDPDVLFAEEGSNPSEILNGAENQLALALAELESGDEQTAASLLPFVDRMLKSSKLIVDETVKAYFSFNEGSWDGSEFNSSLSELLPEARQTLLELQGKYEASALVTPEAELGSFEAVLGRLLDVREKNLSESSQSFGRGEFLAASEQFGLVRETEGSISDFLSAVEQRAVFLAELEESNSENFDSLSKNLDSVLSGIARERSSLESSKQDLLVLRKDMVGLGQEISNRKTDPTLSKTSIEDITSRFEFLQQLLVNQRKVFFDAIDQKRFSRVALDNLESFIDRTRNIPSLMKLKDDLDSLDQQWEKAAQSFASAAHVDFGPFATQFTELHDQINSLEHELRGDLGEAKAAEEAKKKAEKMLNKVRNWTSQHGVTIQGTPGESDYHNAQLRYDEGDYDLAAELWATAYHKGESALSTAELQESRRERSAANERPKASYSTSSRSISSSSRRTRPGRGASGTIGKSGAASRRNTRPGRGASGKI